MLHPLDAPASGPLPARFPSPFRPGRPHPLAERAARETMCALEEDPHVAAELATSRRGGKMMGVLVVRHEDGRLAYLRAFAGTLDGSWLAEGFVPPVFDATTFEGIWDAGGDEIARLDAEIRALEDEARRDRSPETLQRLRAVSKAQRQRSRELHAELHDTYSLENWRGDRRRLRELFAPELPPGGAGDCAGPKLLAAARRLRLRPVAMAEFWWGPPPPSGGRIHGVFYPACRGRCGTLLPFLLDGIDCEPAPDVGMERVPDTAPDLLYEDEAIVVVEKPAGLLSVPGRGPRRRDSVEWRLQQRIQTSEEGWPRLVHRLDLATSGILIAAKQRDDYVALQRQFSSRSVRKRYIALLRDPVQGERGRIELPLRVDLDDRPRQVYDPIHGKTAVTQWAVLAQEAAGTRVELFHHTGRTHQLRVHAAHPEGLASPIVGDRLYGYGEGRLMLHAAEIEFRHPRTGAEIRLRCDCPF